MRATLYKELSNKQTPIELQAGKTIKEALPDLNLDNAIIVINGRIEKPEYRLKENDIITIRLTPSGMTALVVTSIAFGAAALVVGIYGGVKAYQAKKAAEKAQEELEKIKKLTNKSDIDNRPFLRGASNTLATGNSQPYIIGRHFFTPYLLCSPFYKITGTDGANQYTYTTLECGFNKQILQTVAIDDIIIKKFNDSTPQEGAYSIDAGIFAEDGKIEIAQDGALLTDLPALNYKTESTACNDEIPHDSDVEAGTQEYLTYTLNPYAKDVDIAITFPYGLYAYNDDNDKIETKLNITPQFSLDGGSTWHSFTFNNNGTQTTLFKRNVSTKELRFVAHKDFTKADYNTLEANGQKAIYIRVRSNGNKDSMIKNDCYVLYYQSVCFDPDKSTSELVPCRVVEDRERAYCTILGLKLKATKINEDKLKKINIISHGVARTWNDTAWSSTKSATRNPAAWALEVLTSDSHPASKFNDSEIDLDSFGDYYDYCENPENDPAEEHFKYQFDWVITQNTKKDDVLKYILDATGAVIYTDIYGRRAIAIDRPQENALAVYNPQNIININNKKTFGRRTDALRIKWVNSNDDLFQEDTYLLMREVDGVPLTLNENSIIKDITVTGVTTFSHIVKYARRLMAIEALRPKTTIIEVGNEGIFYTPLSKVLIQDDSLKIGIGNGFVIQDISYSGTEIYKILIDGKVTFEDGKQYGIIVQCYGASGATPLPLKVSGKGTTDILQVDTYVTTSSDVFPERGCVFSFGELDINGEFSKVTTEYLISDIKRSDKGFTLDLVNYNEAIYATGAIPTYQSNITQKVTEKAAEIPADYVTKRELDEVIDDLQSGNIPVGKPDTPTLIFGTAERDGITLSCAHNTDGLRNDLRNIVFTITRPNGTESIISSSGTIATYNFNRTIDGYPEAAELAQWSVSAVAVNIYGKESEAGEAQPVSADTYGTWILNPPTVINSTSKRSVILQLSTPSGSREQYSTIQYRVQVQKAGEDTWYKPDLVSDPYADENNYKDGEGYETTANTFIQSVPMESQEAGIKTTAYNYRIVGVSVETQAESEPTIITATATASTAMDIYDSSIGVEKLAVNDLSAISGTFGDIKSDEIEKDATNFWILSKSNSSLGYGRAGEFCVGTTASVEPFDLATNPTGYKENDEFLHYIPSKTGSTLKGLFLKLANFIVDAIASTIRGRFRVRGSTATMAQSVLVVNPESTVDPETNTPANTTDIKTALRCHAGITGNLTGTFSGGGSTVDNAIISIKESFGVVNSSFHGTGKNDLSVVEESAEKGFVEVKILDAEEGDATDFGGVIFKDNGINKEVHSDRLQEQDWNVAKSWAEETRSGKAWRLPTRAELSLINPSGAWWTGETSGDNVYVWEGGSSELVGKQGLVDYASFFNASRRKETSQLVDGKLYIPEWGGTALEIIDTTTDTVTTLDNFFNASRERYTSQLVGTKIYIPEHRGTALEIIDTTNNTVTTYDNFFNASRSRYTSQLVEDKIYVLGSYDRGLDIIDTSNNTVTTDNGFFSASWNRYTSHLVGTKIYIPQGDGTALQIIDTTNNTVTTRSSFFNASRFRISSQLVDDKIYIPEHRGTALEIINTTNNTVTTIDNFFNASREKETSQLVDDKIYIPQHMGTTLEIINTTNNTVTTYDNFFNASRSRYTSQLVGTKIYIPQSNGTGLEIIHTANTLPVRNNTETQRRQVSSSSDGTTWTIRSTDLITAGQTFTSYFGLKLRFAGDTHKVGDYWRFEQDEMGAFSLQDSSGEEYVRAMNGQLHVKTLVGELAKPKFTGKIKTEKAMNKVIFYDEDDEVVNPVNAIAGLEIGDVVWIKYEGYDKLHTVELLEAGYMIVNYEHCDTRGKGSLMLEDKTNVSATVELLTKWYNAPLGLGQAWVDVTLVRGGGVTYINNTGRSIKAIANRNSSASDARAMFVDGVKIKEQSAAIVDGYRTSVNIGDVVPKDSTYLFGNSLGQGTSFNGFYELR